MKRDFLSDQIQKAVALRAGFSCEYCLLPDKISFFSFHIDHIKSLEHRGSSHIDNLAYCCPDCNYYKGSDIGSFTDEDEIIRFFNPRKDKWHEHFFIADGIISTKTTIAKVTEQIFKLNEFDRVIFRQQLIQQNQYP